MWKELTEYTVPLIILLIIFGTAVALAIIDQTGGC